MSHASYTALDSVICSQRVESYKTDGDGCQCERVADDIGQTESAALRRVHVVGIVRLLQGWRV